jgi:hypothetical protein
VPEPPDAEAAKPASAGFAAAAGAAVADTVLLPSLGLAGALLALHAASSAPETTTIDKNARRLRIRAGIGALPGVPGPHTGRVRFPDML